LSKIDSRDKIPFYEKGQELSLIKTVLSMYILMEELWETVSEI
jgi:hypothetical protein